MAPLAPSWLRLCVSGVSTLVSICSTGNRKAFCFIVRSVENAVKVPYRYVSRMLGGT